RARSSRKISWGGPCSQRGRSVSSTASSSSWLRALGSRAASCSSSGRFTARELTGWLANPSTSPRRRWVTERAGRWPRARHSLRSPRARGAIGGGDAVSEEFRIPPVPPEEWGADPDLKRILEAVPGGVSQRLGDNNIFPTFARHPDLFRAWLRLGGYLLPSGKLPGRDRERLILRTAVLCRSDYEWGQHVRISLDGGIDREVIDRVIDGPDARDWSEHEAALLRAADELHVDNRISDATWAELAKTLDTEQL